jgi:hypothetical protein
MKSSRIFIFLLAAFAFQVSAQNQPAPFKSKAFKSLELQVGTGTRLLGSVTLNLNFQKNLGKHLSVLSYSYMDQKPYDRNPEKTYLAVKYLCLMESVGIGSSVGKKGINAGLYLLGGLRYLRTVEAVKGFHESSITTKALLPDVAMLLNMKIGKRKFYFATQIYYQFTRIDPGIAVRNLTAGVGYRF